jgi:serine/threonine-protein kinase
LKRLTKEAGKAPPKKQVASAQTPTTQASAVAVAPKAKSGAGKAILVVVIVVLVLALGAGGAGYWWFFMRTPAVGPVGILELNATPYAEVVTVTSDTGKLVPLPTGDHWTPYRLDDVPLGKYTVAFKGPDGNTQQQECDVAQTVQVCTVEMKPIDDTAVDQIVGGSK